jgi:hypothetical protein
MPKSLKLVEPVEKPDPVKDYEPLFLSSVNILDIYWGQTCEVLGPCIDDAIHGEMTLDDIYNRIKAGQMYCLVFKNDDGELPDVALAMILELVAYPQYTVMNIAAIGGRELERLLKNKFWKHICSWAYMNGVRQMQASVSPAMARIIKSYGFKPVYQTLRMNLTEM